MNDKISSIMKIFYMSLGAFGTMILLLLLRSKQPQPIISPEPSCTLNAIVMPDNAYEQLKNSNLIQVKILK